MDGYEEDDHWSQLQQPTYSKAGIAVHPVTQAIGGRVKGDVSIRSVRCCPELHLWEALKVGLVVLMDPQPVSGSMVDRGSKNLTCLLDILGALLV